MQIKTVLTVLATAATFAVHAVPTTAEQAVRAVDKWLVDNPALECRLGSSAVGARTLETDGGARFHVVRLRGGGFVIVSGDTSVEPIIAFSESEDLVESADNPLLRLLDGDLSRRPLQSFKFAARPGATARLRSAEEAKWADLLGDGETDPSRPRKVLKAAAGKSTLSDCRIAPLLTTEWSQEGPRNVVGETALCYNYYTPNHYPCGCVATACAQIMYYHRQPSAAYDWSAMVEKPAKGISDAGAQAIGRLTAEIGMYGGAEYYPGGASMANYVLAPLLMRVYGYGSAIAFQSETSYSASEFMAAILPNLDAKLPVALGLSDRFGYGHAVVADGYGYDYNTLYLHVNLGWAGMNDAWYAPPAIEDYSFIDGIVCNIDPRGSVTKTLVSGRVLDETGAPVAGAKVGSGKETAVTDDKGIYALSLTPGNQTLTAVSGSLSASAKISVKANVGTKVLFETGECYPGRVTIANQYGVDLTLSSAGGGDEPVPPAPGPGGDPLPSAMSGAVLAADGSVAGVVQLKIGKASKQGLCKVSVTVIGRDGKKFTSKAVNVPAVGQQETVFDVKNFGQMTLSPLNADGFAGTVGELTVVSTDDEPATGSAEVALELDEDLPVADVLTEYLPTDITVERTAKKWTLPKTGKLKYVKANPKKGIEAHLEATGENIAGLKLTYTAKTQTVKGSFKIWTFDAAKGKLKSVSVNVTGIVVDGVGYCDVTYKKQKIGELTVQ